MRQDGSRKKGRLPTGDTADCQPETARSIQFKALLGAAVVWSPGSWRVSLNGETLQPFPLQTTSGYTLYSADVTRFSGSTAELKFTVLPYTPPAPARSLFLDSITFSAQPVPILSARRLGDGLVLSFQTESNRNYRVEQSPTLGTTGWTTYTNLVGDGEDAQIIVPATNGYSFFRFQ